LKKVEKHSTGQVFDVFKELKGSLPSSQKPVIASYPEKLNSMHTIMPSFCNIRLKLRLV